MGQNRHQHQSGAKDTLNYAEDFLAELILKHGEPAERSQDDDFWFCYRDKDQPDKRFLKCTLDGAWFNITFSDKTMLRDIQFKQTVPIIDNQLVISHCVSLLHKPGAQILYDYDILRFSQIKCPKLAKQILAEFIADARGGHAVRLAIIFEIARLNGIPDEELTELWDHIEKNVAVANQMS